MFTNELIDIDLSKTIGKVPRFVGDVNDLTCYFLDQEQFSTNDDNTQKNTVISTFAMACHKAGFTLTVIECGPTHANDYSMCEIYSIFFW